MGSPFPRILFNFFLLLIFAASLASTSAPVLAGTTDPRPAVRSASEIDYPPFSFVNGDQQADGFAVELLRAALDAVGDEVVFATGPWNQVKQALVNGRIDVLPLVGRTPAREAIFDFTFPYLELHGTIVVRQSNQTIHGFADLAGKDVAVMQGGDAEEFVRRSGIEANLVTTPSYVEALTALSQGRYEAVVIQKLLAIELFQTLAIDNLKTVGPPLDDFVQEFCFAVRKGNREILARLNEGLAIVMANGTFDRLWRKWLMPIEQGGFQHQRIIVGGDHNYPPYEYLDENGQPAGYNVELTRAIAEELGLQVVIELAPWERTRQALEAGEIDLIQGMFYSREREKVFDFSPPHTLISHVAVTRHNIQIPKSLADLTGQAVAVMAGDITHDLILEEGPPLKTLLTPQTQQEALRLLHEGAVDVVLVARLPALYWIEKNGWQNLQVSQESFISPEYCYTTRHGNTELATLIADGLATVKASGRYREIYNKHLGVFAAFDPRAMYILLGISGGLLILLAASLMWTKTLRKEVKRQTADLAREIEERKKSEQKLEQSEERFRRIFEESCIGMGICDMTGRILQVNQAFAKITGYTMPELYQLTFRDITLEAHHASEEEQLAELVAEKQSHYTLEKQIIHKGGHPFWVRLNVTLLRDAEEQPAFLLGQVEDIDQAKRLSLAIKHREETITLLLNSTAEGIYGVNQADVCTFCNRSAQELLGYEEKTLVGTHVHELVTSPEQEKFSLANCPVRRVIISGEPVHLEKSMMWRADGSWFPAELWIHPIQHNGDIVGAVVTFLDISEKIKMQEQQLRSSQLAALGELAAGMAHEINNPINGMINYAQILLNTLSVKEKEEKILHNIIKEGHRIATIVRNLLNFSQQSLTDQTTIAVKALIEETLQLNATQLKNDGIVLDLFIPDDLPDVYGNLMQLEQVILNLLSNARHALNKKYPQPHVDKILRISATGQLSKGASMVHVVFFDQGCGIPEEHLPRIFNPFFTTKAAGTGTGLGLAISNDMVTKHGGTLQIESDQGFYTKATLALPADDH